MTMAVDYVSQNMFDSQGHTGNVYYIRIVASRDSRIWNDVAGRMALNVEWLDSTMILNEIGLTGVFPVVIPGGLPAGVYDIAVYQQLGSMPANTDDVEKQWTESKGDIFGF